jgi:hypothetical protein
MAGYPACRGVLQLASVEHDPPREHQQSEGHEESAE